MGNKNAVECFCCNVRRGVVSVRGLRHVNESLSVLRSGALVGGVLFVVEVFFFLLFLYDGVTMCPGEFQYCKFM